MIVARAQYEKKQRLFRIDREESVAFLLSETQSMISLIRNLGSGKQSIFENESSNSISLDELEWLPPIDDPEKIICVGRNYVEHADEMGAQIGDVPVIFSKFNSALIGNEETIQLPAISQSVDFEAELVVVVGREGKNIPPENAMDHVFGFTCGNDVSARDWQKDKPGGQWLLGKTFDTFAPTGPWIVTLDSLRNFNSLDIRLKLNGKVMQQANTSQLIFDIPFLIAHLSQFVTLQPGDLIFTGTPPGVGAARDPQVFLKDNDDVEIEIEGIGILKNRVSCFC